MLLVYEDREEMQRSMRKASIQEVFICERDGKVRVTAMIDSRSLARYEAKGGGEGLSQETESWRKEHFTVLQGEVQVG